MEPLRIKIRKVIIKVGEKEDLLEDNDRKVLKEIGRIINKRKSSISFKLTNNHKIQEKMVKINKIKKNS